MKVTSDVVSFCLAGLVVCASISVDGQSNTGIRAEPSGCLLLDATEPARYTLSTDVPCVDGLLHGEGNLEWRRNDGFRIHETVNTSRGVTIERGRYVAKLDLTTISSRVMRCDLGSIDLQLIVPDSLALEFHPVTAALLAHAKAVRARECDPKLQRVGLFNVFVYRQSDPEPYRYGGGVVSFAGDASQGWERVVSNQVQDRHWAELQANFASEKAGVVAAARQEELRVAAARRAERRSELAKKTGAFEVITLAELEPNPYLWQGKTVASCVRFDSMVDATSALVEARFRKALVTGVPSTRFRERSVFLLVARVSGQSGPFTSLRYISAIDQRDGTCGDFIDPPQS